MKGYVSLTQDPPAEPGETLVAPRKTYALVPDEAVIVRARDVAREAQNYGVRGAAEIFGTSPSTISRFLRMNGYKIKATYERAAVLGIEVGDED